MAREVDERKKRKALRKLRKAAMLAEQGLGPPLSDWEKQFLEEVEDRIETYGSAFNDPEKGAQDEPLSALQSLKLREIDKKARGKGKSGFKQRKPLGAKKTGNSSTYKTRQLDDELDPPKPTVSSDAGLKLVKASELKPQKPGEAHDTPKTKKPVFRVINGGAADN